MQAKGFTLTERMQNQVTAFILDEGASITVRRSMVHSSLIEALYTWPNGEVTGRHAHTPIDAMYGLVQEIQLMRESNG